MINWRRRVDRRGGDFPLAPSKLAVIEAKGRRFFILQHLRGLLYVPRMFDREHPAPSTLRNPCIFVFTLG